jgi:hypothetical protein
MAAYRQEAEARNQPSCWTASGQKPTFSYTCVKLQMLTQSGHKLARVFNSDNGLRGTKCDWKTNFLCLIEITGVPNALR